MSREAEGTEKYSFTFEVKNNSTADQLCAAMKSYFLCATSNSVRECIAYIEKEKRESKPYHNVLICSRVFECILHLLRLLPSTAVESAPEHLGDMRLAIAKQYIADNVCYAVSVGELAAYCHIGKEQLTRIFLCEEGCTVAEYVRMVRCRYIEKLLKDPSETLLGISEQMHFSSEYYFNSFFKRCSGMTPGAYRRSVLGTQ
jgi:AraC-like DNA-binding protein